MIPEFEDPIGRDIKEIQKRGREIILITIVCGLVLIPIDYFKGLYKSALVVVIFLVSMIILFFLNQRLGFNKIKIPTVFMVCIVLVMGTLNEGLSTGNFFYYFPMLIIVPAVIDSHRNYKSEFISLFVIAAAGAATCLYIGMNYSPLEFITKQASSQLFYINFVLSFIITIVFAYLNIKFEREYISTINEQKNHSIAARTKFLSIMGHELRTPLNGIIGASNVLKEGEILPDQKDYLDILSYCSDHMLLLVNDILDFNKIEAGRLEIHPISLNLFQMLKNSALPFYNLFEAKDLEFKLEIDPTLNLMVMADDVRLIQILNNLLSNALKFTEKGSIKLSVKANQILERELEVLFMIEDTGIGIEEKYKKLIFESFWQIYDESNRSFTGTGLGLNICMRLLNLMNSSLKLDSKLGEGSRFYFTLKLPRSFKSVVEIPFYEYLKNLKGFRILLVEDNQINMLIAKKSLLDFKADLALAMNGLEALKLLEKDSNFDLILLDLEMPVMNGYTAIGPIRAKYPEIPVLAFTASLIDQKKLEYLFQLGFQDCILKPYQSNQLLERILKNLKPKDLENRLPATASSTTARISSTESAETSSSSIS